VRTRVGYVKSRFLPVTPHISETVRDRIRGVDYSGPTSRPKQHTAGLKVTGRMTSECDPKDPGHIKTR